MSLALTYECISPWENMATPLNLGSKVGQDGQTAGRKRINRVNSSAIPLAMGHGY